MSIASRQKQVVDNGFLDLLGEGASAYREVTLTNVIDSLVYLAAMYKDTAHKKLIEKDRVSSGALGESIQISDVRILGKLYQVDISLDSYYKFVDQGVNGWAMSQGSPFNFKRYTGKSGAKSSLMVTAIRKWLIREGLMGKNVKASRTIHTRERRQASITDTSTKAAIIMSRAIRKKGLKATHFWSETEQVVEKAAKERFAEAIKIDIINNLYGNSN